MRVYLALPTRVGFYHYATLLSVLTPKEGIVVTCGFQEGSVASLACNAAWCHMMQAQEGPEPYDYFCLLHDDIIPQADWIEVLIAEIQRVEADVLAVVIPGRDESGQTMTGIADSSNLWATVRRLSLKEIHALPETFGQEILLQGQIFSTSTGCMIVDAKKSWVLENQVCFRTMDSIVNHRDKWMAHTRTEDETFIRDVQLIGAKLCLTRKVELQHCDWRGTSNQEVRP